jgi:hypothetical protein
MSIHVWHLKVSNNSMRSTSHIKVQSFTTIMRFVHSVPSLAQLRRQQVAGKLIIVCNQYYCHSEFAFLCERQRYRDGLVALLYATKEVNDRHLVLDEIA